MPKVLIGNDIDVDATVSEEHMSRMNITTHSVAFDTQITDHAILEPARLNLECWISNTPIDLPDNHTGGAQQTNAEVEYSFRAGEPRVENIPYEVPKNLTANIFGVDVTVPAASLLTGGRRPLVSREQRLATTRPYPLSEEKGRAIVSTYTAFMNRRLKVYESLLQKMRSAELLTVVTSLAVYDNMVIESLTAPVLSDTGDALNFTINLRQIQFAVLGSEDLPNPKRRKLRRGPITKKEVDAVNVPLAKHERVEESAAFVFSDTVKNAFE